MKRPILAAMCLFFASVVVAPALLWGCSSGSTNTVCTDAGAGKEASCTTTTTSGGW